MHVSCLMLFQSDKSASLDVPTNDFASPSFYPHDASKPDAQPLIHGFISSNRVADFVSQLKLKIVQRLVPGLRKDGYVEETEEVSASTATPANPPRATGPPRPRAITPPFPEAIPDYLLPNPRPYNPLEIGRSDLDPFGADRFSPPPLFPPHGGDGMFVGPDHLIFGSRGRRQDNFRGPWGGDGYLPPMGAPPGARFDPVGPDPNHPLRPAFGGRPRGGRPGAREPDNDEFMPPGMVRMLHHLFNTTLSEHFPRVICSCRCFALRCYGKERKVVFREMPSIVVLVCCTYSRNPETCHKLCTWFGPLTETVTSRQYKAPSPTP